jgi:heat shock protein HslJ
MLSSIRPLAVAWLLALLAWAAGPAAAQQAGRLDQTSWVLAELPGTVLLPGRRATLGLADGRVQGDDGCNRYRGTYTADEAGFRMTGPLLSTKMACPEPVMRQAAAFVRALEQTRSVRREGGRLTLLDDRSAVLAILAAQDQALGDTAWQVTGYNNGRQAVVSVLTGSRLGMTFADDGRLSGSAGCNDFKATYTAAGRDIQIGAVASTRKFCAQPEELMQQEAAFLQALQRASVASIEGELLALRSADGALQVTAVRSRDQAAPGPGAGAARPVLGAHGLRLPASFRGDLPCADCEAIRHHLDLWPDQVFHLHRVWLGRPDGRGGERDFSVDDLGRWRVDPARNALILQGGAEPPLQFEIRGPDRLRALDRQGRPIESDLPYELHSDGTLAPAELALRLDGELRYLADAARFTECRTGRSYPVALADDWVALERAYLAAVAAPGDPLYVTFEGEIAARPRMEGAGTEPTVVVRRFGELWPRKRCPATAAQPALTNTYWRVLHLGGQPLSPVAGRREPYLLLQPGGRYRASVGCNQLLGGYTLDADRITFAPGAATLMACPPPLDAAERRLVEALAATRRWRSGADGLALVDARGAVVARFEAGYF